MNTMSSGAVICTDENVVNHSLLEAADASAGVDSVVWAQPVPANNSAAVRLEISFFISKCMCRLKTMLIYKNNREIGCRLANCSYFYYEERRYER